MADKKKIGASIVLDGEKEFKAAVTACNKNIKEMRSELSLTKEKYADSANSLIALREKHEALSKVLEAQKAKLEATKAGYNNAVEAQNKVGTGLDQLKKEYTDAVSKMDEMKKSGTATDTELEKQQEVVDKLSNAIQKGEKNYESAGNRVQDWKSKLNTAESQVYKANNALNENDRYMREAKDSTDGCAKSINEYGRKVSTATDQSESFGKKSNEAINNLAESIVATGLANKVEDIANTLLDCADAADEFETATAKVSTIAEQKKVSMETLKSQMLKLSGETGESASDIAESTYQAISASVDTSKAIGTVKEATRLAQGGFTDTTTAIDGLTTVMNSYGNKVKSATQVSDMFVTVQNKGKIQVGELASSIGKVATKASMYNVSLADLGASYIEITKRGVDASQATTNINSLIKELSKNGSASSKILQEKTKKSFADLMKSGKSLADVVQILSDSVNGNATEFGNLFSRQEASQAAMILMKTGTQKYNKTLKEVKNSAGATSKAYKTMADTSEMAKKRMVASVDAVKIAVGDELNESLKGVYENGQKSFQWAEDFVKDNPSFVHAVVALTTSLGTLTTAFAGFAIVKTITPMITAFNAALASNPAGLVAVAVATLVSGLLVYKEMQLSVKSAVEQEFEVEKKRIDKIREATKAVNAKVEAEKKSFNTAKSDVANTELQAKRLMQLNNIQHKTKQQKLEMQGIVDHLKGQIPGLAKAYDSETGSLRLTNAQIRAKIKNYKQLYLTQAAEKEIKATYQQQYKEEQNLAKSKKEQKKAQDKYNSALKKQKELLEKIKKTEQKDNMGNVIGHTGEYVKLNKQYKQASENVEVYKDTLDLANNATNKSREAIKKCQTTIKNAGNYIERLSNKKKKDTDATKSNTKAHKNLNAELDKTKTKANAIAPAMKTSGQQSAEGLIQGVTSKRKDVINTYSTLGKDAHKAFNKSVDIHSPSRKFKKSGQYTVQGIVLGVNSEKKNAVKAMQSLGKDMYKTFTSQTKQLSNNLTTTLKNANSKIKDLKKSYNDSVKSTKQDIANSYGLFDDANSSDEDKLTANDMINNLSSQNTKTEQWSKDLATIRSRKGASKSFVKYLEGLGVSEADNVNTIANMTDEQFAQYMKEYNTKQTLAKNEAVTENKDLKTSTEKQITNIEKATRTELENRIDKYKKYMKEKGVTLGKSFSKGFASSFASYFESSKNNTKNFTYSTTAKTSTKNSKGKTETKSLKVNLTLSGKQIASILYPDIESISNSKQKLKKRGVSWS